ncbi:hypothetical protein [Lusitaniella coriacea]|uniref:hypothetical protein n=1 Tax=Lusitaniella coriacea TaxID=1983105 RepID=UPI003CE75EAE
MSLRLCICQCQNLKSLPLIMHHPAQNSLIRMLRLGTVVFVPVGLALLSLPHPAKAAWNPFEICSLELIEENINAAEAALACAEALEPTDLSLCVLKINGLTPIDSKSALRACFRDRRPLELAECVVDITQEIEEQQLSSRYDAEPIEVNLGESVSPELVEGESGGIRLNVQPGMTFPWRSGEVIELQPGTLKLETDTVEAHSQKTLDHCRRSLLPKRFSECVIGLRRSAELPTDRALNTCIEAEDFPRNLFPFIAN